jgi:hypothetical protein
MVEALRHHVGIDAGMPAVEVPRAVHAELLVWL